MTPLLWMVLLSLPLAILVALMLVDAGTLARWIKRFGWVAVAGVALLLLPRMGGLSLMLLPLLVPLVLRALSRGGGTLAMGSGPNVSTVRSAAIEMELDHETGEMDGLVLAGTYEGRTLAGLERGELFSLREEVLDDPESVALLDAYLDRRFPEWGENEQADFDAGEARPAGSGPMSEQEAYEVLGLPAGASAGDVREAHRRLMKGAHPDRGGSTFLASKINEAKDVLLGRHE